MQCKRNVALASLFMFLFTALPVMADKVTTKWGGNAEKIYDTGFMHMLMKHPDGGVCLFNMDLMENDAPGAGRSEKGVYSDCIRGPVRARKILYLDDPRAHQAWLVTFSYRQGAYPLKFTVNGHTGQVNNWDKTVSTEAYRWTEFPAQWLKKGKNIIDFFCPEAESEKEGWVLYLARSDEFEEGGGDPSQVGETSYKSTDGGKSWKKSPFGPNSETRAEYSIRLSLDRFIRTGWLASPVIDLWRGESRDFIIPLRTVKKMRLSVRSQVPEGTTVTYYLRKGRDPGPFGENWEPYEHIGKGASLDFKIGGADLNRRYIQFKAVLSTTNPLKSPILKSAAVTAELEERVPLPKNIYVVAVDNNTIRYSSLDWAWEPWDRPEFQELRMRENLDEVIAGCRTEFDAQVKLLDYVTRRWRHGSPLPEYPGWDALSILNRVEYAGTGGFCLTFNNVLAGLCMAYGWQARLVNVVNHEICEVWNNDFGKWIFLDADYQNCYNYDATTAEPQGMLELHEKYMDYYFPKQRPIDWMSDRIIWMDLTDEPPPVRRGSLTHHKSTRLTGFINAAFMRMVPRNNWYEKPYPRPLAHGTSSWPWDGYINWYDQCTPPMRQYSLHTDRPRDMWPDLNKVHIDATSGFGNDRLFLRFETYTPNFDHFEVNVDDTRWKTVGERYTWLLGSGRNTLQVQAVNKLGARGKPSSIVINHADAPLTD